MNQNMREIVMVCVVVLGGIGTIRGWSKELGLLPLPRGGHRFKKLTVEKRLIHPDAKEALAQLVAKYITVKNNYDKYLMFSGVW